MTRHELGFLYVSLGAALYLIERAESNLYDAVQIIIDDADCGIDVEIGKARSCLGEAKSIIESLSKTIKEKNKCTKH